MRHECCGVGIKYTHISIGYFTRYFFDLAQKSVDGLGVYGEEAFNRKYWIILECIIIYVMSSGKTWLIEEQITFS